MRETATSCDHFRVLGICFDALVSRSLDPRKIERRDDQTDVTEGLGKIPQHFSPVRIVFLGKKPNVVRD
ncbi:hypothetical protein H9Q09_21570 [Aurantimonas sp. DM33-3]|nr:hypothetical protein [Aurantimonas sp. DM33-3]